MLNLDMLFFYLASQWANNRNPLAALLVPPAYYYVSNALTRPKDQPTVIISSILTITVDNGDVSSSWTHTDGEELCWLNQDTFNNIEQYAATLWHFQERE
jgi:hypothetical protein